MNKYKYLLIIVMFMIGSPKVYADGYCSKTDILRVKKDASNVTIEYEFIKDENNEITGEYNIYIKGITEDMYITEETTDRTYTSNSNVDGIITIKSIEGDNLVFKLYYEMCDDELVRTIKLNLPKYNYYSEEEICKNIPTDQVKECDMWYQGEVTDEILQQKVNEYNLSLKDKQKQESKLNIIFKQIIDFLIDYYIYIIISVIAIVTITIMIIIRKKRYTLE